MSYDLNDNTAQYPGVDYTKSRTERRKELREMGKEYFYGPKRINPPKRGPNRKMRRAKNKKEN